MYNLYLRREADAVEIAFGSSTLPVPLRAMCKRMVKHDTLPWNSGFGFWIQGSGFRVQGSAFRVQGSGFKVQGSGLRVHLFGIFAERRLKVCFLLRREVLGVSLQVVVHQVHRVLLGPLRNGHLRACMQRGH